MQKNMKNGERKIINFQMFNKKVAVKVAIGKRCRKEQKRENQEKLRESVKN